MARDTILWRFAFSSFSVGLNAGVAVTFAVQSLFNPWFLPLFCLNILGCWFGATEARHRMNQLRGKVDGNVASKQLPEPSRN